MSTGLRLKYQTTLYRTPANIVLTTITYVGVPVTMAGYEVQTAMHTIINYVLSDNTAFFGKICSKLFVHIIAARSNTIFAVQRRAEA